MNLYRITFFNSCQSFSGLEINFTKYNNKKSETDALYDMLAQHIIQ